MKPKEFIQKRALLKAQINLLLQTEQLDTHKSSLRKDIQCQNTQISYRTQMSRIRYLLCSIFRMMFKVFLRLPRTSL